MRTRGTLLLRIVRLPRRVVGIVGLLLLVLLLLLLLLGIVRDWIVVGLAIEGCVDNYCLVVDSGSRSCHLIVTRVRGCTMQIAQGR